MEKRAPGAGSSSYGQACVQCYKAKCRCVTRPDSDGCERCLRLKKQCQPSQLVRKRVPQNHETGAQIAKLEGKIEALTSMLQSVVKATGVSANLPPSLNEALSAASTSEAIHRSANTLIDMGTGPTPLSNASPPVSTYLSPFPVEASSQPFPPRLYEPMLDEAEGYLELFQTRMLPCFPFIYLSPGLTARQLRDDRPFLFRAIVAVATPSTQQKVARIEGLKYVLAKSSVLENRSSIDMLLSILTYITWSTDPFLKRTSNLFRMIMLAISLVYDLQLARPLQLEAQMIAKMAPGLGDTDRDAGEASSQDFLEQQRAVLACFVLSSIISSYFRRTDAIRWTPQMEEGLRVIGMNQECPSDEALAFQVRLQLLAQGVAQVQAQHEADRTDMMAPPAPASLYLRVLQGQLQELKASLSSQSRQSHMLAAYAHYVELCIYEVPRPATSEAPLLAPPEPTTSGGGHVPGLERVECLWRCLHAAKAWLDAFHMVPPVAYVGFPFFYWFQLVRCIVILKHLSTFEDPAWDPQTVYNTVDMFRLLDEIAEKAEVASREASEECPDDLFWQVSSLLRRSQAWVHAKRKAAAQAAEGAAAVYRDGPALAGADDDMAELNQTPWMTALHSGNESWFEDFLGWSPETL